MIVEMGKDKMNNKENINKFGKDSQYGYYAKAGQMSVFAKGATKRSRNSTEKKEEIKVEKNAERIIRRTNS